MRSDITVDPKSASSAKADSAKDKAEAGTTTPTKPEGFAPVAGGELTSGAVLLVEAYAVIWLLAFVFIYSMWRRTRAIESKVDGLKRAIDSAGKPAKASAAKAGSAKAASEKPSEDAAAKSSGED
jgi:hypothetical protein